MMVKICMWLSLLLYCGALFPQIALNYRLKSVEGLSDLYILALVNGYLAEIIYVFLLDLPWAYKIMIPSAGFCACVIAWQRFYYSWAKKGSWYLVMIYSLEIVGLLFLFWCGREYWQTIGYSAGWASAVLWSTYEFPQMIKMLATRSVHGFSFAFATLCGLAAFLEGIAGYSLALPLPTLYSALRGIIIYVLISIQFAFLSDTVP